MRPVWIETLYLSSLIGYRRTSMDEELAEILKCLLETSHDHIHWSYAYQMFFMYAQKYNIPESVLSRIDSILWNCRILDSPVLQEKVLVTKWEKSIKKNDFEVFLRELEHICMYYPRRIRI